MQRIVTYLFAAKIVRFFGAGSISTIAYFVIYAPLSFAWPGYFAWWAVLAFMPSAVLNFELQKAYTFGRTGKSPWNIRAILFLSKEVAFFGLNIGLLLLLEQWEPGNPNWHQIIITPPQGILSYLITHRILAL